MKPTSLRLTRGAVPAAAPGLLKHRLIAQTVAAIVADGGGCVEYGIGGGGREVLTAASAQLASATNSPLTIVESRVLHSQIRTRVSELKTEVSREIRDFSMPGEHTVPAYGAAPPSSPGPRSTTSTSITCG